MALSRIPITPNMDTDAMAQAINQNFEQLESENRTKVIRDENGQNRILIGMQPNGKYGVYITKPGVDVLEELQRNG